MKLSNYKQFLGEKPLNENLDKAKKFLKDRFLLKTAAEDLGFVQGELKAQLDHKEKRSLVLGDFTPEQQAEIRLKLRELRLKDDEVRTIERNPEFLKIREALGQQYIGWTYPFTYFYFVEMVSLEELFTNEGSIFNKLIEYKGLLDKLPKNLPVLRDYNSCLYLKEDAGKMLVGIFEPNANPAFKDKGWCHRTFLLESFQMILITLNLI
mgnify:CR=1 FL=1